MAKTEVILTHNIIGLGGESDQVRVAAGYARNYLYPQRLAIPLTQANKRQVEALRKRRAEREAHELNTMTELAKSVRNFPPLVIKVKTGEDGKMFGSVTSGTISDELKHAFDVALDKKKIHLEHPIRTIGEYEVDLRLHADVTASLKVRVESTTPVAAPESPAKAEVSRTEKRGKRADVAEVAPEAAEKKSRTAKTKKSE